MYWNFPPETMMCFVDSHALQHIHRDPLTRQSGALHFTSAIHSDDMQPSEFVTLS